MKNKKRNKKVKNRDDDINDGQLKLSAMTEQWQKCHAFCRQSISGSQRGIAATAVNNGTSALVIIVLAPAANWKHSTPGKSS